MKNKTPWDTPKFWHALENIKNELDFLKPELRGHILWHIYADYCGKCMKKIDKKECGCLNEKS